MIPIQLYIQPLFLHTVFLSVFKSTNSCFRCLDIYVCTWRTHSNTTNTLSYSFSHSVELPLGFTGVVLYLHHLCETVTFTRNNLDTVRMTFQFTCAKAVPAHYSEFYDVCFFVSFCHLLLSKAAYVYDCVYRSNTCLSPFTKGMVNYFLKTLPVPKNNLTAAPWLFSSMQPLGMRASCVTGLTAHEGKCHNLG